ncbi:hypothetical protein Tco_0472390 [Tanacetum coccineum]
MEGYTLKQLKGFKFEVIKDMFDKAFKRINTFVDYKTELVEESSKRAEAEKESSLKREGEGLEYDNSKKQKIDDDQEEAEMKKLIEIVIEDADDITIDAITLATKPPSIVDWNIYKEDKKSYYQIIRADRGLKLYQLFNARLRSFDREDLETVWKLVKARFKSTKPVEDLDLMLC